MTDETKPRCPFRHGVPLSGEKPQGMFPHYLPSLKIFRLHPAGVRVERAHMKLKGGANMDAIKWCGPYSSANALGWWLYPPVDMDVAYLGDSNWESNLITDFPPLENYVINASLRPEDPFRDLGRMRLTFSKSEPDTIQIWTGCIFRTPPGWVLHVRSPVNFPDAENRPCHIQEGIIEADWMNYDIWLNIKFHRKNEVVQIRRDMWPPIAQIVPIRREAFEGELGIEDRLMDSADPACSEVWSGWQDYNYRKWKAQGEKDPLTFHKSRKPIVREMRDQDLIP